MFDLDSALSPMVGPRSAEALKDLFGMRTVRDLLTHYPRRYVTRSVLTPLDELQPDEHVTVMAEVRRVQNVPWSPRRQPGSGAGGAARPGNRRQKDRLLVDVTDGRGTLRLTFFNQSWRQKELRPGVRGLFSGKVGMFRGQLQFTHPDYLLNPDEAVGAEIADLTARFIPIYPATAKFSSWALADSVKLVLAALPQIPDPLPPELRQQHGLMDLDQALRLIHRPEDEPGLESARERLKYDEALMMQLVLARRSSRLGQLAARPRPAVRSGLLDAFDQRLPFELTRGQRDVGTEISADLTGSAPMHRLLQGDVGSGKTLVALRAMLQVVDSGGQSVLLAPTEVLAQQHHRVITEMLGPLGQAGTLAGAEDSTEICLLTASLPAPAKRAALAGISSGRSGIIIGTHALLEESVSYHDLGLVVVDEQHRFGVEQRAALTGRGGERRPHVLVMTATPIPRTIAITVFGDLETSVLSELPPGRIPVVTHVVAENDGRNHIRRVWERARDQYSGGHQVFVVCPQISPAEPADQSGPAAAEVHSVTEVAERLGSGVMSDARIGQLHGGMSQDEKDDVMSRFARGPRSAEGLDVLVATTVVEVGVDIPQASMMVILDADRFGVSQLHQLRGRVGRGGSSSLCILLTRASPGSSGWARLEAVAGTLDGFELARLDLGQRGEGDILGQLQSGRRSSLRLLSVLRDEALILRARSDARRLVAGDLELASHPELAAAVVAVEDLESVEYLEKG